MGGVSLFTAPHLRFQRGKRAHTPLWCPQTLELRKRWCKIWSVNYKPPIVGHSPGMYVRVCVCSCSHTAGSCTELKSHCADCCMGNLTAKVMAIAEMDDRRSGPVQPWFFFFSFLLYRNGPAEVLLPSLSSVSLYRLMSLTSQGDAVAVAAPVWLNALTAASVPFIPVSPAESLRNVSHAVFFCCSVFVVRRRGSCCCE